MSDTSDGFWLGVMIACGILILIYIWARWREHVEDNWIDMIVKTDMAADTVERGKLFELRCQYCNSVINDIGNNCPQCGAPL